MPEGEPTKRTRMPGDTQVRAQIMGDPVFEDVFRDEPADLLNLLGGKLYEVGYQDGLLYDLSRNRRIRYRVRYPKGFSGPAAVVMISPGGTGDDLNHVWYPLLGTVYARLGFLAVTVGHQPSANEAQHRFNCPVDVGYAIDALTREAAALQGIPWDDTDAMTLPDEFGGLPDVEHIGVIGHSYGAYTAHAAAGMELAPTLGVRNFRDPRVDAIVAMASQGRNRYGCFDKGPDNNSWKDIAIPCYLLLGDQDFLAWRREPFDRYPSTGDKFLTIGKDQSHSAIAGAGGATAEVKRMICLNTALFFHTYLRGGAGRERIGTLEQIAGWTLERKLDPTR